MPITIDKRIDLTTYSDNPAPKVVRQLSIIHEARDGELVQYYLTADTSTQGDKASHAEGVYDENARVWRYVAYDALIWKYTGQRITGAQVDRLNVKAFPGIGAFAVYKLKHRTLSRVIIPVNRTTSDNTPPTLSATVNQDGGVTFGVVPPEEPEYVCYRVVMQNGIYSEEYITYETTLTVPRPKITGTYYCYAVGYAEEGQLYSRDSAVITLTLIGESDEYVRPYYTSEEIDHIHEDEIDFLQKQVLMLLEYVGAIDYWADYEPDQGETVYIADHNGDYIVFHTTTQPNLVGWR